jgi:hypothetical protein
MDAFILQIAHWMPTKKRGKRSHKKRGEKIDRFGCHSLLQSPLHATNATNATKSATNATNATKSATNATKSATNATGTATGTATLQRGLQQGLQQNVQRGLQRGLAIWQKFAEKTEKTKLCNGFYLFC